MDCCWARLRSFVIGIFIHIMKQKSLFLLVCTFRLSMSGISLLTTNGNLQPGRRTGTDAVSQAEGLTRQLRLVPLITTVNDLVAVVTYYGLAEILLVDVFHLV